MAENNYSSRKETSKSLKFPDYPSVLRAADPKAGTAGPPPQPRSAAAEQPLPHPDKHKPAHRTGADFTSQPSTFSLRHRYHQVIFLPLTTQSSVHLEQSVRVAMIKTLTKRGRAGRTGREAPGAVTSSYGNFQALKNTRGAAVSLSLGPRVPGCSRRRWTRSPTSATQVRRVFSHSRHPGAAAVEKAQQSTLASHQELEKEGGTSAYVPI